MERGYTILISDELRSAIDMAAAEEPTVFPSDIARRWLEIGRKVHQAGCAALDEFCRAQHQASVASWVGEQDAN